MFPSLLGIVLVSLSPAPSAPLAQQGVPLVARPVVRGGPGSPFERIVHVVYDVQLDRVRSVRTSRPGQIALGTTCFDNSEHVEQYVVANPGEDLLCWGRKSCAGGSRLRSFTMAYSTEADDPSIGGPGAAFSLALYQGTTGFGNTGTEIFRRTFTRQPGMLSPGFVLVLFTVDFGTEPLPLPDGRFGWSYMQLDGATGPILVSAPDLRRGTVDALDIYSPGPASAATYVGTFNYGGCTGTFVPPCANLFMQLDEIALGEVASTTVLNGSGANPEILQEVFPARIGHVWAARVRVLAPQPTTTPYTALFLSRAAIAPLASRFGEVLIDPARLGTTRMGKGSYTFSIPADTGLVGLQLFAQALVLPPVATSPFLTNALSIRVGF